MQRQDSLTECANIELACQQWLAALDVLDTPIFLHDQQFRILRCNKAYQQCAGMPFEEIIGQPYYAIFPKSGTPLASCLRAMGKAGGEEKEEVTVGDAIYRSSAFAIHDDLGTYLYSVHTLEDITERKQAEEKAQESEKKFKSMTDTSPLAIYISSGLEQKAEYINPTFIKLFGYTLDEVPSVSQWWPLAYPDEKYRNQIVEEWQRKVEQAIKTNSAIEPMETVVTCKDGTKKTISWGFISTGVQDWSFGQDLTERKQAEEARQKSEEAYRMLYESSRDAIMTLDAEGNHFLSANPAAVALFGCRDEQEFISLSPATASPPFQPDGRRSDEKAREMVRLALDKGLHFFEWTHKLMDGTEFFANVLLTRMEADGKKLLQATVRDITERKRAEHALKESERVKSELLDKLNQAQHLAKIGSWE